jgi:hypothetical protein
MLCLLLVGEKREREREMERGLFPRTRHALLAVQWLLGAIKG